MNVRTTLWLGIFATALPVLVQASPMTIEQVAYRWRNDNGSEVSATWKAVTNTPIAGVKRDENIRLRFAVWNSFGSGAQDDRLFGRIEYAENVNGPWMPVGLEPGRSFQMATTTGYTNGQPTTAQLTLSGSAFMPGQCVESPANIGVASLDFKKQKYSNLEYCFRATALAKRNTTYYFRLSQQGGNPEAPDSFTYLKYAVLTIENTDPPAPTDIYVDDDDVNTIRIGAPLAVTQPNKSETITTGYLNTWEAVCANKVGAWQGGSRFNGIVAADTNNHAFRWVPMIPLTAQYNVYARWVYEAERGQNVPYSIRHAGGTVEVFVNQRDPSLSAKWNLLGTYTFNAGTNGWVELGGNDGQACADAVWLHLVN